MTETENQQRQQARNQSEKGKIESYTILYSGIAFRSIISIMLGLGLASIVKHYIPSVNGFLFFLMIVIIFIAINPLFNKITFGEKIGQWYYDYISNNINKILNKKVIK